VLLDLVADLAAKSRAAQPRWVSRIWPTFMRLGTPSGFSTTSTGRAVFQVRHVLFRADPGEHALVAVPAGHLVADLQLALDGDEHLHHLDDARRQLVARLQPLDLVVEGALDLLDLLLHRVRPRARCSSSTFSSPILMSPQ
jgi:hypothetical protein